MKKSLPLLLVICSLPLFGQSSGVLEFINRPVAEILFALGEEGDMLLLPDETVVGTSSFYFPGGDVRDGVDLFLKQNRLYMVETDSFYTISRIRIAWDGENLEVDSDQVSTSALLRQLSNVTKQTILFDDLPDIPQSVHYKGDDLGSLIELLIKPLSDYQLVQEEGSFFIQRVLGSSDYSNNHYFMGQVNRIGDLYSLDLERGDLGELIERLCQLAGAEYLFLSDKSKYLEKLSFQNKSFEELFDLILMQCDLRQEEREGIYYILDQDEESRLKDFSVQVEIPLKHRSTQDILALIPQSLQRDDVISVDEASNSLILFGLPEVVSPLAESIRLLDHPQEGWISEPYQLSHLSKDTLFTALSEEFKMIQMESLGDHQNILISLPEELKEDFDAFLMKVDALPGSYPIRLSYLKAEQLLETIPPGFNREEFHTSDDDSLFFFQGSERKYYDLLKALEPMDIPIPQIRYDVLVIQYQDSDKLNWDVNFANSVLGSGDQQSFVGALGSALTLSFDVVSAFGYLFSLNLSADISHSRARVMADTTLNGLTNQEVSLQNTSTFRYRDTVKDLETGNEEVTGISREITSGLFIKIKGWVSGDDMITMDVSTTVSRQDDVSTDDSLGSLPPTTEKVVNTHIRTQAGEPVVIGGLIQSEKSQVIQKTPLLGSIPILGLLFQERMEILENTEMVIYIIPHLDEATLARGEREEVEALYEEYKHYLP